MKIGWDYTPRDWGFGLGFFRGDEFAPREFTILLGPFTLTLAEIKEEKWELYSTNIVTDMDSGKTLAELIPQVNSYYFSSGYQIQVRYRRVKK